MAFISGAISFSSRNFEKMITPKPNREFSLTLPDRLEYDVALDQSSTCTGIAIFSTDDDLKILLELARDTGNKETFYRELKKFLILLFDNKKVRVVICEDPPPVKGQMYSSRVLLELRGRVSEWMEDIEAFQEADFKSIFPQSWKSLVIDKSKGKNRSSNKRCIADDVSDIFPCFRQYFNLGFNKDYDGFDAVGILTGYRRYAFTPDGVPMISGTQEKRHTSFVWYRYLPIEALQSPEKLNADFGPVVNEVKPEYKAYNRRYDKFNNIRMASSNTSHCVYTALSDKEFDVVKWKYGLEKKPGYVLLMYVMNKSKTRGGLISLLEALFPMHEEVCEV